MIPVSRDPDFAVRFDTTKRDNPPELVEKTGANPAKPKDWILILSQWWMTGVLSTIVIAYFAFMGYLCVEFGRVGYLITGATMAFILTVFAGLNCMLKD